MCARAALLALLVAGLTACGGSGGDAPVTEPPVPRPSLPVLTTLTVVVPTDTVQASLTLTASVRAVDEKAREMTVGLIDWNTSDPKIATVSSSGLVQAMAAGTVVLSAQVGQVIGRRTLVVLPPPPGPLPVATIAIQPTAIDMDVGTTRQLEVVLRDYAGTPLTNREVTFTSTNDTVALVSADGVITARSSGTAYVEAVSEGRRTAAAVTVRSAIEPSIEIAVSQPLPGAEVGDTILSIVSVRSELPLDSVVLAIGGRAFPMTSRLISNGPAVAQPIWVVSADVSTIVGGPLALVFTAYDAAGRRGVLVVPVVHRTLVPGGGKQTGGSK